ncbi:hypothetical protein V8J88_19610 [Massilia sp. W12]|uniref:hypothetical protein n=1 Tax=Massilia sp. W12 TaxID=3126507 RepID=UPI0030D109FF
MNVRAGGPTVTTDPVASEIPHWIEYTLLGLGLASATVLFGPVIAVAGLIGGVAGGYGASYLGGVWFGEGSDGQRAMALGGSVLGALAGARSGAKFYAHFLRIPGSPWQAFAKDGARGLGKYNEDRFWIRRDDRPYSSVGAKADRIKSHIDSEGNLRPANPHGKTNFRQHIRGAEPAKSDSPYTSFSEKTDTAKLYGQSEIKLDIKKLEADIQSGKLQDVEIFRSTEIQKVHQEAFDKAKLKYENNPSKNNLEKMESAKNDLKNTMRDVEGLIKGIVPSQYFTVK